MTEQQIIDLLFFLVREVFGNVIYFVFLATILTPKYNKWLTVTVQTVVAVILYYAVKNTNANIVFLCFFLIFTVSALLFYKEKKRYCLFAVGVFFITSVVSDMLVSPIFLYVYGYYPTKLPVPDWSSITTIAIVTVFSIIIFAFVALFWNKFLKKKDVKSMGMFLLFPLGQTFFVVTFTKGTWENKELYAYSEPLLIASVIISVVADIVMYFALKENSDMNNMRRRLAEIENEMEQQLKYYDALAEKYTEIREYRHDILNLVSVSEIMLNNKLSEKESKEFISSMKQKAESMEVSIYCNNPLVNAVLWQKQQLAEKSGIEFRTNIEQNEDFPIDRIDICSLIVNLMDNALRECENCENAFMEIEITRRINMLFIVVRNSCSSIKNENSRCLPTTKDGDHGYGMEIINKIAEKYGGEFVFTVADGIANASVMLEIK